MKNNRTAKNTPQILSGWKEIANYLGKGVRTVQRYERLHGFPVRRPAGKPWGSVVATTAEIDAWVGASPLRDDLWLLRPSESTDATWAQIQSNVAESKRLVKQMTDLRQELRSSVRLLRRSVQEVQLRLIADELSAEVERNSRKAASQAQSLFNLLNTDTAGRKAS